MRNPDSESNINPIAPWSLLLILVVVFAGGYLVMALEILAFRIIQAGIDSSILATGAILGVVLTALTIGYWFGGTLSVRMNPLKVQSTALLIAGIWIFSLAGIPNAVTDIFRTSKAIGSSGNMLIEAPWETIPDHIISNPVSDDMGIRLRVEPLLASLILFAIPSLLLAMVGPCAVQVITRTESVAGQTAGWVFAVGSLGSIAGVVITSFWLIAFLGISANLRAIGALSVLAGILAWNLRATGRILTKS